MPNFVFDRGAVTFYSANPISIEAQSLQEAELQYIIALAENGQHTEPKAIVRSNGSEPKVHRSGDDLNDATFESSVPSRSYASYPQTTNRLRKRKVRMEARKAEALASIEKRSKGRKRAK